MTDALGTAKFFIEGEKWEEAKQVLDLVRPFCKSVGQLDAIGSAYSEARDWKSAVEVASMLYNVLSSGQSRINARHSLIKSLLNINDPERALYYIAEQEREEGLTPEYQLDKSVALFMNNQKREGELVLEQMLLQNQDEEMQQRCMFNMATHQMMRNNHWWKTGLKNFLDYGRLLGIWKKSPYPEDRRWTGRNGNLPVGSVLFVVAEGGIGDEIINFRFAKTIQLKGIEVRWGTNRNDLAAIFDRHGVESGQYLWTGKHNHYWAYSMDLPVCLGLEQDQLWDGPYLRPIGNKTVPNSFPNAIHKLGFKFQGNPHYEQDLHRSLPCKELQDVIGNACDLNKIQIYNFDIDKKGHRPAWWVNYLGLLKKIQSWDDTLDYLDQMDLVVTSCTSVAHAASAMGKKTVVMVPIMNYYIWANGKEHSDWYGPDTYVIRQTKPGCWKEPLDELGRFLKTHFA
jgi:hypothetical protein